MAIPINHDKFFFFVTFSLHMQLYLSLYPLLSGFQSPNLIMVFIFFILTYWYCSFFVFDCTVFMHIPLYKAICYCYWDSSI